MAFLSSPEFWVALSQIILINIVLSGDNAVVIALACRSLPPSSSATPSSSAASARSCCA